MALGTRKGWELQLAMIDFLLKRERRASNVYGREVMVA